MQAVVGVVGDGGVIQWDDANCQCHLGAPATQIQQAMASWNTCKKGRSSIPNVAKQVRALFGDTAILLQEVPAWGASAGYVYHNHVVMCREGSDCGFLIPRRWTPAIRSERYRDYWAACVAGNVMLISAHILDHLSPDGRGQQ
eukprot:3327775-Pyramimonas_sp.AAC.1